MVRGAASQLTKGSEGHRCTTTPHFGPTPPPLLLVLRALLVLLLLLVVVVVVVVAWTPNKVPSGLPRLPLLK